MLALGVPALAIGMGWTTQPLGSLPAKKTIVFAVSCARPGHCAVVGGTLRRGKPGQNGTNTAAAVTWSGSHFSAWEGPDLGGFGLKGVSCPTATACMAVGGLSNAKFSEQVPYAARWDGHHWTSQHPPDAQVFRDAALDAVSCATARNCVAVGTACQTTLCDRATPLIESWNGSGWRLDHAVAVKDGWLDGVSCVSASNCEAVGFMLGSGIRQPLAEMWNGATWMQQSVPAPTSESQLAAVSCTSATNCVGVGLSGPETDLGEVWNGTDWRVVPMPGGADDLGLSGISCASSTACVAVGPSHVRLWNGTSFVSAARPTGGSPNFVSCPTLASCVVTGLKGLGSIAWRERAGAAIAGATGHAVTGS